MKNEDKKFEINKDFGEYLEIATQRDPNFLEKEENLRILYHLVNADSKKQMIIAAVAAVLSLIVAVLGVAVSFSEKNPVLALLFCVGAGLFCFLSSRMIDRVLKRIKLNRNLIKGIEEAYDARLRANKESADDTNEK